MTGRKIGTRRDAHHRRFDGFDCARDERFRLRIARRTTTASTLIDLATTMGGCVRYYNNIIADDDDDPRTLCAQIALYGARHAHI